MAARVNTKFLLLLFVLISTAVVLVGGVYIMKQRSNGARFATKAEVFMNGGQYKAARRFYERAVGKEPENLEFSTKLLEAIRLCVPETQDEARELYQGFVSVLKHEATHHPMKPEKHLTLLEELTRVQRTVGADSYATLLGTSADDMLNRLPAGTPERIEAKLYQGIARFSPEVVAGLEDEVIESGERALVEYLEEKPDSGLAWNTLILGRLAMADRYRRADRERLQEEWLDKADEALAEAEAATTEDVHVTIAALGMARYDRRYRPDLFDANRTVDQADMLMQRAREDDLPGDVIARIAGSFETLRGLEGMPRSLDVLTAHVDRHPEELDKRLFKSQMLYQDGDLDGAEAEARAVLDAEQLPASFLSQVQFELRRQAASRIVDVRARRWDTSPAGERDQFVMPVTEARKALDALVAEPSKNHLCIRALGKEAFVNGRFSEASAHFSKLIDTGRPIDFETMIFTSVALERLGELGSAIDRMQVAYSKRPDNTAVGIHLAGLLQRTGKYERGVGILDQVLDLEPDNSVARRMRDKLAQLLSPDDSGPSGPIDLALASAQTAAEAGQYANARGIIAAARESYPEDLTLLMGATRVEMLDGQPEEALVFVNAALELAPDNTNFQRVKLRLENDDPIELIKQVMSSTMEDGASRDAEILITLAQYAEARERAAERLEAQGETDAAAEARATAERVRQEEKAYAAKVRSVSPEHPRYVEYAFVVACEAENWSEAERLVELAQRLNLDQSSGALFEGRLAVARDDAQAAVAAFKKATERTPYAGAPWRFLGMAYNRLGMVAQAVDALDRAYEKNPNNIETIRVLSDLLMRTGKGQRALDVLRKGRRLDRDDARIREAYFRAEASYGDLALVLAERRALYEQRPDDKVNASALARLLGSLEPRLELLIDKDGNPRYSAARWEQIPRTSQRARQESQESILAAQEEVWHDEADAILEALATPEERALDWHIIKAYNLKARGEVDGGLALLEGYAARPDLEERDRMLAHLSVGTYLAGSGRVEAAIAAYEAARPFQSERLEADHAIGDVLFRNRQYDACIPYLERVADARDARIIRLQLVEALTTVKRFGEATARLSAIERESGSDVNSIMLRASNVIGEADQLWIDGDKVAAESKYEQHLLLIDEAERADPANALPHVLRAVNLFKRAIRTQDAAHLDDALRALSRADEVQANLPRTMTTRADVLQAQGNLAGASAELRRLLELNPASDQARQLLLQLELRAKKTEEAVRLAQEAVDMDPSSLAWRDILGDLNGLRLKELEQERARASAGSSAMRQVVAEIDAVHETIATTYDYLLEVDPTPVRVLKRAEALLMKRPPDFVTAGQIIAAHSDQVSESPILRTVWARVLSENGQRNDGLDQMEAAYKQIREMIADGRMPSTRSITPWYMRLRHLFGVSEAAKIEEFVNRVSADRELLPEEYQALSIIWRATGPESMSHRIELLNRGLAVCPPNDREMRIDLYLSMGVTYLAADRFDDAIESMERVVEEDPNNAETINNLAYAYAVGRKDLDKGLELAEKAVELNGEAWTIVDTLGYIHYLREDYRNADRFLRRSSDLTETAVNQYHLALVAFARGELSRAERYLARAAQLNPDPRTRGEIEQLADDIAVKRDG